MVFSDRREAGRHLAAVLTQMPWEQPVVVALPRGGVPIGFEVARALAAPLDLLAVRKLGAPGNPELGVGAIAEDGTALVDTETARHVGMTEELMFAALEREIAELRRRVERYREGRCRIDVKGRTVIVVDDGLATGLTALVAVRALRASGPARLVVAVPVGSREGVALVGREADEVVCPMVPRELFAVGRFYEDFSPVSDDEVTTLLGAAASDRTPTPESKTPRATEHGRTLRLAGRGLERELGDVELKGDLVVPSHPRGLVIFAHGSGSSRLSPRNRTVAATLNEAGLATLLFDLLTDDEDGRRELVFDIPLLARRLEGVTRWAIEEPDTRGLPVGYFGASTGAAAALRAAAAAPDVVQAVVSRGGRPDLAADRAAYVTAPTLLLVGSRDPEVLELNRQISTLLRCPHRLEVIEGAGHLFSEPGTLARVAELAAEWFGIYLTSSESRLTAAGA